MYFAVTFELSGPGEAEVTLERLVWYMAAHSSLVVLETPVNLKICLSMIFSFGLKT